jgi:uncharacterized membrane protein YeaQ/YmgE (transglycosylase-associated protein family)
MDVMSLLVSLISGAVGGNVAGAAMKDKSLGTIGNSLAGILGGGLWWPRPGSDKPLEKHSF